ncbi:hypothetical protein [Acinetobacter sp. HR7]|uniref:hypothetical protein n=1 Tax=Acinetobacter sp. HR7 TaxID=1509403 RepID=UPI0005385227|nr:hypothetical protein [Acinetobacter sp. HR7]KGT46512.1 hypothetical protein GW12_24430 [Acinetobacter sp. HR7]
MKFYKKILTITAIAISVTACKSPFFSNHIACDDQDALTLVNNVLKSNLDKSLESELKSLIADGAIKDLDPAKLKLSAQNITFTLSDSRTEFIDPNSPKTNCSIDLSTTIPSDLLKKSDEARAKVEAQLTETQAHNLEVDYENGKINLVLEYTLQPNDKGDKIFALVKNSSPVNTLITDTLTYAFLKPQIEKNQVKLKEAEKKQQSQANRYSATQAAEDAVIAAQEAEAAADLASEEYYEDY